VTASELAAKLEANRAGDGWIARCPAHDDHRASLSIGSGDDGKVLVNCHAGCEPESIAAAAGVVMADLFPAKTPKSTAKAKKTIVSIYEYEDEEDQVLYEVLRYEPKDFRQRRPDGKGGHIWNMTGVRRVLFALSTLRVRIGGDRLHNLPDAVFVSEGEKDGCASHPNRSYL
jgi:hypothetical protein